MKLISVVGARPNFMKIAPFIKAIDEYNEIQELKNLEKVKHILVHTGQHYDDRMSTAFFSDLKIPDADINLGIGSGSHAEQVGNTMIEFEKVLVLEKPDWVIVVGDVNATLACSVTAKKEHIKVAHIEAGLRSGDMFMPEEINRLVTDRLSDLLLTPDNLSGLNLIREGVPEEKIKFVGNIMIDTLEANRDIASKLTIQDILKKNSMNQKYCTIPSTGNSFGIVTLHRPSNVDSVGIFKPIIEFILNEVVQEMFVIWPIHPRARKQLERMNLWELVCSCPRLILLHPLGYHEMLRLNMEAVIMLTDSGGLQEECTILGTPCLTLRWNTERPVTLRENGGASVLVGNNILRIRNEYNTTRMSKRIPVRPELWDGKTAGRIVQCIINYK